MVRVDDDYDYDLWNPLGPQPTYWDESFSADLETGSNASFAHTPLVGAWLEQHWRHTNSAEIACMSHRGVRDGAPPGSAAFEQSLTPTWHRPSDAWIGSVCFGDNHVEYCDSSTPDVLSRTVDGVPLPDNLFLREHEFESTSGQPDAWLTFTSRVYRNLDGAARAEAQFD